MIMNTNIIVDLLEDGSEVEIARSNMNRKKLNELKKYIPFLEYILKIDPGRNQKYQQILNWLRAKREFPVRIANTCEKIIKLRYKRLNDSMVFPASIKNIFAENAILICISDEDDEPVIVNTPQSTSNNVLISDIATPTRDTKPLPAIEDDISTAELFKRIDSLVKEADGLRSELPSWQEREKEDEARLQKSPILRQKNLDIEKRTPKSVIPDELLSPVSDQNEPNDVFHKKKRKNHKHKKKSVSDKYISEDENHAVLKEKILKRKSVSLSTEEHDTMTEKSSRKQKKHLKKKKNKKTKQIRSLYISDDDDEEIVKATSNTKEELPKTPDAELFNRRDSQQKRSVTSENLNREEVVTVVLLDSDDEKMSNSPPAIVTKSGKTFRISKSPTLNNSSPPQITSNAVSTIVTSGPISSLSKQEVTIQKEQTSVSTNELNDLNNMGLTELNDIYSKLCETTGIQLEELLIDLVTTTKSDMDTIQPTVPEQLLNNANVSNISLNNNNNNFFSNEEDLNRYEQQNNQMHLQQVLQLQLQQQQQQQLHQQQQHQIQQQQLQQSLQCPPNQMHLGLPEPYNYQNNLRPGLNLNDPRIVQKLKQIKDSPIHNLNIRESASYLMNCHTSRPVSRTLPVVEVTSKTAKTYGEHKRLREMEQQKKREQEAKKSLVNNKSEIPKKTPNQLKRIENEPAIKSRQLPKSTVRRKTSSGSESERRTPKPVEKDATHKEEEEEEEGPIIMSFSMNSKPRRRIESSSSSDDSVSLQTNTALKENSSSGRMTPFEMEKVVGIVLSAMGNTKEGNDVETLGNISKSSKSRRSSARKSRDSAKSDETSKSRRNSEKSVRVETGKHTKSKNNDISNKISPPPVKDSVESNIPTEKRKKVQNTTTKNKTSPVKRGCRELNNLNCTFQEYKEMFEKNWFPTYKGKRRCSIPRGLMAYQQLDSSEENLLLGSNSDKDNDSDVISTPQMVTAAPIQRRRQTCSSLPRKPLPENNNLPPLKVIIRRISESGTFGIQDNHQIDSDNTDEFDIEEHRKDKVNQDMFQPQVILRKLSLSDIKALQSSEKNNCSKPIPQHNEDSENHSTTQKDSNVSTVTSKTKIISHEIPLLVPSTSEVFTTPKISIKRTRYANVNPGMTLASTKTCAICNKRSNDLTNHYVVQHKTESYISRLTSENIENLEQNITLAVPYRNRYKVSCVFCHDELEDSFNNFYAHYSYHTGEYGFRCDVCWLAKPFREEIRAHQHRASRCRNSKIRTNYLYSPDLTVIYLYVCMICNFVQLNEANIHKHHRDHHSFNFDEPDQIKKCIIAAIDSSEVVNECLPINPEEDAFKEQQNPTDVILGSEEQEFVHECPLDIKDILMLESLAAEIDNEIMSTEQIKEGPTQENQLDVDQPNLQETGITNLDDGLFAATSPEDLLAQVHASQIPNNIMTVIHHSNAMPHQESHVPYVEPVEMKPDIQKIEIPDNLTLDWKTQLVKTRMTYRKLNSDSTYFGLYKCMVNDCWFSTNASERFIEHMSTHTNIKDIHLNCAYCTVILNSPKKLVLHIRSRHSMSRYQCSECSYRSMIPGNITIHRKIYHVNSTADKCIYECVGRVRKIEEKLIVMKQKMIENVAPLKCPDCSLAFYALRSLKLHIQKKHRLSFEPQNSLFHEFACIYCKMESNSEESMKIHLATDHPDEMAYVVERKLKSDVDEDAIENLNMINISALVLPANIHPVRREESKNMNWDSLNPDLEPKDANTDMQQSSEDSSLTKKTTVTKEEQLVHERIRPLLALLTENTGVNLLATLYRCVQCNASFFKYDLWLAHIKSRHSITENVDCPYCFKNFALKLMEPHFATHSQHAYICFHCVTSFCSRERIIEHFSSYHKNNEALVEKEIPFGAKSFYIVTTQDVPVCDWIEVLANWSDTVRTTCIEKRQQNMDFEWWQGLASSCLEDIEIPNYISSVQSRFKCLVRSCPFVGLSEDDLDRHVNEHTVPRNYKCSHCALNLSSPSWENIKNHKMLHKDTLYICCVCKFIHHKRSAITKHIEILHNSRDVPVVSLWRGDTLNYTISLEIVLPPRKTGFTNSTVCFCCRQKMNNNTEFVQHLRMEHNISLFLKCELCDKILLTQLEAKTHNEEHGMQIYSLKYVFAATYLYNLTVKTMSPITIEMQLMKKKRANDDAQNSTSKRSKLDETVPHVQVKEEVVVKTECVEDVIMEDINNVQNAGGSIKCVNIKKLVVDKSVTTSNTQESSKPGLIFVKSTAELQMAKPVLIPGSHISPELSATYLSNQHNNVVVHTPPAVQSSYPYLLKLPQRAPEQFIINVPLPNNQGTAYITRPSLTSYSVPSSTAAPTIRTSTTIYPDISYPEVRYPQQNDATTAPQPICPGVSHSGHHTKSQQNAQISLNLTNPQSAVNNYKDDYLPFVPEIAPICEHCRIECTDFSHLMTHFEAVHEPKNLRFLFRIARKIECVYCSFRGSLSSLPAHQMTFHPGRTRLCRNITDSSRCGVCNEIFSCPPSSDGHTIPKCACPMRQRPLADCLDLQTLKVLQHFGRQFKAFKCALCTYSCDYQIKFSQHILNVHHRNDILPEVRPISTLFYVCNLCGKTTSHIKEATEHIRSSHLPGTSVGTLAEHMMYYNKIGVIYPHGLRVDINDLRNAVFIDEKVFTQDIQRIETQYNTSRV